MLRLVTWNVNGIRSVMKKGFEEIAASLDPDFFCLQEIKAMPDQVEIDDYLYPYRYINSAKRKGYSGTMIMTRYEAKSVSYGLGDFLEDDEGRVITLEYDNYYVVTVYTPNSKDQLARLDYRMKWDEAFGKYIASLNEKKPVLLCGDFNVARGPKDIWDEADGIGSAGYSDEERNGFENNLLTFMSDAWRYLYPDTTDKYTWWSYVKRGRDKNRGWRIDYWLVSKQVEDKIKDVVIYDDIYGSDHCPVELDIDL